MIKTWSVMVVPKRGEVFRREFVYRPMLTMALHEAIPVPVPTIASTRQWLSGSSPRWAEVGGM